MESGVRQVLTGRANNGNAECLDCSTFGLHELIVYGSGGFVFVYNGTFDFISKIKVSEGDGNVSAVSINGQTGAIAAVSGSYVWIYRLRNAFPSDFKDGERRAQMTWEELLRLEFNSEVKCLSWSVESLLAVGGKKLYVYKYDEATGSCQLLCEKQLAQPLVQLKFSPNGTFFATRCDYDSIPKVWCISQCGDNTYDIEFLYLRHPRSVFSFSWRKRTYCGKRTKELIMTFCADNVTRFWMEQHRRPRLAFAQVATIDPTLYANILPASHTVCANFCSFGSSQDTPVKENTFSTSCSSLESLDELVEKGERKWCVLHWMDGDQIASALRDRSEAESKYLAQSSPNEELLRTAKELRKSFQSEQEFVFHVAADGSLIVWSLCPGELSGNGGSSNFDVYLLLRQVNALLPQDCGFFVGNSVHLYHDRSMKAAYGESPSLLPPEVNLLGMNKHGQLNMYQLNVEDVFQNSIQLQHHHVRLYASQSGHPMCVTDASVHPSLPLLATRGKGGVCAVWRINSPQIQVRRLHVMDPVALIVAHDAYNRLDAVNAVAWVPSSPHLLVCRTSCLELYAIDVTLARQRLLCQLSLPQSPSPCQLDSLTCFAFSVTQCDESLCYAVGLCRETATLFTWRVSLHAVADDGGNSQCLELFGCFDLRAADCGNSVSEGDEPMAGGSERVSLEVCGVAAVPQSIVGHAAFLDLKSSFDVVYSLDADLFCVVDAGGGVYFYRLRPNQVRGVCPFECNVRLKLDFAGRTLTHVAAKVFGKIAFVLTDKSGSTHTLQIWGCDPVGIRFELEMELKFKEPIESLSWYLSSDSQSLLAVAVSNEVRIYCPSVYAKDRWVMIACVNSLNVDSISLVTWLRHGGLMVASESLLIGLDKWFATPSPDSHSSLTDSKLPISIGNTVATPDAYSGFLGPNILALATAQSAHLPQYHPISLMQYVYWNDVKLVKFILCVLARYLYALDKANLFIHEVPFLMVPFMGALNAESAADLPNNVTNDYSELFGEPEIALDSVDDQLPLTLIDDMAESTLYQDDLSTKTDESVFDLMADAKASIPQDVFNRYAKYLLRYLKEKPPLPRLSVKLQLQLGHLIKSLMALDEDFGKLDANGQRFWFALREHADVEGFDELAASKVVWALHSESQLALFQALPFASSKSYCWAHLRKFGVGYWLTILSEWPKLIEVVARNHYIGMHLENYDMCSRQGVDMKNPLSCTLFYLALGKKPLLIRLWEQANGHPEQQQISNFLKRDFTEERNRTAAAKNAFILLGKQRYELAAAFFLLADKPQHCVSVCVKQLNDPQLGLVIALLLDQCRFGSLFLSVIKDAMLPLAVDAQDLWRQHLLYTISGDVANSLHCLLKSSGPVVDPELLIVYLDLQKKVQSQRRFELVKTTKYSSEEKSFIQSCAIAYERQGLFHFCLDVFQRYLSEAYVESTCLNNSKLSIVTHILQALVRSSELVSVYGDLLSGSKFFDDYFERLKGQLFCYQQGLSLSQDLVNRVLLRATFERSKLLGVMELLSEDLIASGAWETTCTEFFLVESNNLCRLVLKPNTDKLVYRNMTTITRNMIWAVVKWRQKSATSNIWSVDGKVDEWNASRVAVYQAGVASWVSLIVCQLFLDEFSVVKFFVTEASSFFATLLAFDIDQFGQLVRGMLCLDSQRDGGSVEDPTVSQANVSASKLYLRLLTVQFLFLHFNSLLSRVSEVAHGQIYLFLLEGVVKKFPGIHASLERQLEQLWSNTSFEQFSSIRESLLDQHQVALWDFLVGMENPFDVYNRILEKRRVGV